VGCASALRAVGTAINLPVLVRPELVRQGPAQARQGPAQIRPGPEQLGPVPLVLTPRAHQP